MMRNILNSLALLCTVCAALATGSLYIRGIRDDLRTQEQLNERLKELCDQARQSNWTEQDRTDFLSRHCKHSTSSISP